MEYAPLYPTPPKAGISLPAPSSPEPVLDKTTSVHWKYAVGSANQLEDLAWRNLSLETKRHRPLTTLMGQLAAVRTKILDLCARMDVFPKALQGQVTDMLEDAKEVGEEMLSERGISHNDHPRALDMVGGLQQNDGRQRAKIIFDSARRRFDPRTDLQEGLSPFAAAVEITRRIREDGKFVFTEEHRGYLKLSGPLHELLSRFGLLLREVHRQIPKGHGKRR